MIVGVLVQFALDGFLIKNFARDQDFAHVVAKLRAVLLLALALRDLALGDEINAGLRDGAPFAVAAFMAAVFFCLVSSAAWLAGSRAAAGGDTGQAAMRI